MQPRGHRQPGHGRHVVVRHHHVHRVLVVQRTRQGLVHVGHARDAVAQVLQQAVHHGQHHRVVVHDQHMLAAAAPQRLGRAGRCGLLHLGQSSLRQQDVEGAAAAWRAVHLDGSTVGSDDAMYHRQAQARALSHRFGGEEGFEDARTRGFVHAAAIVVDADACITPRWQRPGRRGGCVQHNSFQADVHRARVFAHGVPGVGAKIHQHLLQLGGVGMDEQ